MLAILVCNLRTYSSCMQRLHVWKTSLLLKLLHMLKCIKQ